MAADFPDDTLQKVNVHSVPGQEVILNIAGVVGLTRVPHGRRQGLLRAGGRIDARQLGRLRPVAADIVRVPLKKPANRTWFCCAHHRAHRGSIDIEHLQPVDGGHVVTDVCPRLCGGVFFEPQRKRNRGETSNKRATWELRHDMPPECGLSAQASVECAAAYHLPIHCQD